MCKRSDARKQIPNTGPLRRATSRYHVLGGDVYTVEWVKVLKKRRVSNVGLARLVFPTRKLRRYHLGRYRRWVGALTPERAGKYLPYRVPNPTQVSPDQGSLAHGGKFCLTTMDRSRRPAKEAIPGPAS